MAAKRELQDVKEAAAMPGKTETCRDAESRNQSFSSSESGMMQDDRERKASCEGGTPAGGGQSKVMRSASRTKRLS